MVQTDNWTVSTSISITGGSPAPCNINYSCAENPWNLSAIQQAPPRVEITIPVFSFLHPLLSFRRCQTAIRPSQSSRQSSLTGAVLSHTSQNRKQVTWTQHVVIMTLTDEKLLYLTVFTSRYFSNSMSNFYPKLCCCHLVGLTTVTPISRASVSFNWPAIVSFGLIVKKEESSF